MIVAIQLLPSPELVVAVAFIAGLTAFLWRHSLRRTFTRWKLHRERTRVRREYWGYE